MDESTDIHSASCGALQGEAIKQHEGAVQIKLRNLDWAFVFQ